MSRTSRKSSLRQRGFNLDLLSPGEQEMVSLVVAELSDEARETRQNLLKKCADPVKRAAAKKKAAEIARRIKADQLALDKQIDKEEKTS